jgi:hypothetical protein
VTLEVGATLEREVFRRYRTHLTGACRQLFGFRQVLLATDGTPLDLGAGPHRHTTTNGPRPSSGTDHEGKEPQRVRQRAGADGQSGIGQRLETQRPFRLAVRDRREPAAGDVVASWEWRCARSCSALTETPLVRTG